MRAVICFFCLVLLFPVAAGAICQVNYKGELAVAEPVSVSFDSSGRIYVAQDTGVVTVFNSSGQAVLTIGGRAKHGDNILERPTAVFCYDQKIYVTDSGLDRIAVFTPEGKLIECYGEKGGAPGEFDNPSDIYIYQGTLYVADTGNDRIQVLGENGVFLDEIGTAGGDKRGRLNAPREVAVDRQGWIYVIDKTGDIKLYSQKGRYLKTAPVDADVRSLCLIPEGVLIADEENLSIRFLTYYFDQVVTFGSAGDGRGQFRKISSVRTDADGKVYVADDKQGVIHIFFPEKDVPGSTPFVSAVPPPTSALWTEIVRTDPDRQFSDIAVKNKNTIYAIDSREKIICIFQDGRQVEKIALPDIEPDALTFDKEGVLYVLSGSTGFKLTPAGKVDYPFRPPDGGGAFFSKPGDLAITSDGLIYVADRNNRKVHVFHTDGIFNRTIERCAPGMPIDDPAAVAVDAAGQLYLLDAGRQLVAVLSPEGTPLLHFSLGREVGAPVDLAVAGEKVYVLDAGDSQVLLFSNKGDRLARFGSPGERFGCLDHPSSMAAVGQDGFLVADSGNHRLQEFALVYTPPPPDGIEAAAGGRNVRLRWEKSADPLIHTYGIYRSDSSREEPVLLAETSASNFVDQTVKPGVNYVYRLSARAQGGNESVLSHGISATAEKFSVPPPAGVTAMPRDFFVTLSWEPVCSDHFAQYVICRDGREIDSVKETTYIDQGLLPETVYLYKVAAESTDRIRSWSTPIRIKTLVTTRPPVDFESIELSDVFSNTCKNYEKNGLGTVTLRNNTKNHISKLKVLFTMKKFMDFASESIIRDLAPGKSRKILLKAVFNDQILNIMEDTPVQTAITASYYLSGELKTFSVKKSINVYEKHKMCWDEPERVAAFVTTKDEVLLDFVRSIVTQYDYPFSDPIISACILFDALGTIGLTYTKDPSNSSQEIRNATEMIDYLQYPRETMKRKSGDCDDLAVLYAAALESIGICTRFVEVPEHLFMMFEVGRAEQLGADTMNNMLVIADDRVWMPVEVTSVGKPFTRAWECGSSNYYDWENRGLSTIDLHQAWEKYQPASLPQTAYRPDSVARATIEKTLDNEFESIRKTSIKIRNRIYFGRLQEESEAARIARLQLGIEYARYGLFAEAMKFFGIALQQKKGDPAVLNNMGNVAFLQNDYKTAIDAYSKAIRAEPDDPLIRVNLAKAYLKIKNEQEAKRVFQEACAMNPEISREYRAMALMLLGPG